MNSGVQMLDREKVNELYPVLLKHATCLAKHMNLPQEDAEDVTQQVLTDCINPLSRIFASVRQAENTIGYLKAIIKNALYENHRYKKKEQLVKDETKKRFETTRQDRSPNNSYLVIDSKFKEFAKTIRKSMDQVCSAKQWSKGKVNYYAVFIFLLRQRVLQILVKSLKNELLSDKPDLRRTPEKIVIWSDKEEHLKFLNVTPRIGNLWIRFVESSETLSDTKDNRLLEILNKMTTNETAVQVDIFYQWRNRAKKQIKSLMVETEWNQSFGKLL